MAGESPAVLRSERVERTCDVCSERGFCRTEPESEAYICERCDAEHEEAIQAAAALAGVSSDAAQTVVDAYHAERARLEAGGVPFGVDGD